MRIGYVSSEGGPFLIGDYQVLRHWEGIETDDYDMLIQNGEEDFPHNVAGQSVAVWDPEGGALVSVHNRKNGDLVLIKSFEELEENEKYMDCQGQDETLICTIEISSGMLLLLQATESAADLKMPPAKILTRPAGDWAFEDSVLAIPVNNGHYRCISDYVFGFENLYQAKRLTISYIQQ